MTSAWRAKASMSRSKSPLPTRERGSELAALEPRHLARADGHGLLHLAGEAAPPTTGQDTPIT